MGSLRSKIMASYGVSSTALLIFVVIIFADLHYLQTHINEGEVVNQLYVASQQMRTDEKNLFLHHNPENLARLRLQAQTTKDLFTRGKPVLAAFSETDQLEAIANLLGRYQRRVEGIMTLPPDALRQRQQEIRTLGHELTERIRGVYLLQRTVLDETTRVAKQTLIVASMSVILLSVLGAFFTVRHVVRPLGHLEEQLDEVAEGRERNLTLLTNDKEIQSFVNHFNAMIEELSRQQHKVRQHEKAAALGVLVSGVAHELNNPLSNISTSVQLLLEDDGTTRDDLRKQWLSHVDGECERARRIVRRLLDSVRQTEHHMRMIAAPDLVGSAVMLLHRQYPEFLFHIEDICDSVIPVDRERMQQVFINLMKNAIDAGSSNIWIVGRDTTWADARPEDRDTLVGDPTALRQAQHIVLFQVLDDGPGVPQDHLARIFDPFFTTQAGGEGTGLGLYLVEEIVSEHSGCVAVENRKEGGTCFFIWLPADGTPEDNPGQEASP